MKIHHVGYLTKKLEKTEALFLSLGFTVEQETRYDEIRQINIEFLRNGDYVVELVQPASQESPMYPLLKNYKNTPYHFCYISGQIDEDIRLLEEQGYRVIQEKREAPCIDGRPVVFLLHPSMGILELVGK